MIEYIKGELTDLTPAMAVVEAAGVGYALNISLNTFTAIQGKHDDIPESYFLFAGSIDEVVAKYRGGEQA